MVFGDADTEARRLAELLNQCGSGAGKHRTGEEQDLHPQTQPKASACTHTHTQTHTLPRAHARTHALLGRNEAQT